MWWRHPFIGDPEEVLAMARKLVEHKHDGSDASDMMWDGLLDDLRAAVTHYDRKFRTEMSAVQKLLASTAPVPRVPTFDWPYALRCHGGDGKGFGGL